MTPNEIVAANLERIRTETGLSRKALAEQLGWTEHRIVDLEHGRERRPSPKPDELFALCNRLPVTLFDLFLPPPGIEDVDLPLDSMDPQTVGEVQQPTMDRGEYGQMLFAIPARSLEPDNLRGLWDTLASDNVRRAILAQHPKVVELLEPIGREQRDLTREMFAALAAGGLLGIIGDDGELIESANAVAIVEDVYGSRSAPPMGVEEAREEERRLRHLFHETTDYGVDQVERQIRNGLLPEPRLPEDPAEVWTEHVRGDHEQFDALVSEWLEQINEQETK